MLDPSDPYTQLGLPPDAERSAVDRAYRALMKRHHPDRGGDPERAAAINRAYAEITRPAAEIRTQTPTDMAAAIYARRIAERRAGAIKGSVKRRLWPLLVIVAATSLAIGWIERDAIEDAVWTFQWNYLPSSMLEPVPDDNGLHLETSDTVYARVNPLTIARSVETARAVLAKGGLDLAADSSQRCYHALHSQPSFAALDHCLALDDAVLLIAGAAAADRRGFGAVALTSRQLEAGRDLGGDFSGIEERLDRVRLMTLKGVFPETVLPPLPERNDGLSRP